MKESPLAAFSGQPTYYISTRIQAAIGQSINFEHWNVSLSNRFSVTEDLQCG